MSPKKPKMYVKSRYQDKEEIAEGGVSVVYKVYDRRLRRNVAMKVYDGESHSEEIQRFLEEAQVTAQLEHPNIIPVYDQSVGEDGVPYIILKLIKGVTLLDLLHEEDYHPGVEADLYKFLQIFIKVCDALSFAHSHGVIHRDLKPENIMVGDHGEVYLMDWGLVRLVENQSEDEMTPTRPLDLLRDPKQVELDIPGEAMGTFTYLPPEQAWGQLDKIDKRTDVFALGAILYEILTQAPLYSAWEDEELLEMARTCDIPPPQELRPDSHLSSELCRIAMKALQKEHDNRYQSVQAMQSDVELFLRGYGRLTNQTFQKGTQIIYDGDEGDKAYLVVRGRCIAHKEIDGKRQDLHIIKPGEIFGEVAAFSSRIRTANVEALDDVEVKVIDKKVLDQEFGFGSWIHSVLKALASRFSNIANRNLVQRRTISTLHIVTQMQLQMTLVGERIDKDLIQTSWSEFHQELQGQLQITEKDIIERIDLFDAFSIDDDTDLISLDLQKLQLQLLQAWKT